MRAGSCHQAEFFWDLLTLFRARVAVRKSVRTRREAPGIAGLWPSFATPHPRFFVRNPEETGRNFTQPIVTRRLQSLLCCVARASFRLKSATIIGRGRETSVNGP